MGSVAVEKLVAKALAAAVDEGLSDAEAVARLASVVEQERLTAGHVLEASFRCLEIGSDLPVCRRASEMLDSVGSVLGLPGVLDGRSRFLGGRRRAARKGPPSPAA